LFCILVEIIKTKNHRIRYDIAIRDGNRVRINGVINGSWFNVKLTLSTYNLWKSNKV